MVQYKLEIDALTTAIGDDLPTGKNLREDISPNSLYYQTKDARSRARAIERQQMQGIENLSAEPEWQTLFGLATKALQSQSKDLEVAAWLIEASLRLNGYAGLYEAFQLYRKLSEQYWETIYPEKDEDGYLGRVSALAGLNGLEVEGTLIVPITSVPITQGVAEGDYSLWHYTQALEIDKIADPDKKQEQMEQKGFSRKAIEDAIAQTPVEFLANNLDNLEKSLEEFKQLTTYLDQQCEYDAPPSSNIRNALQAAIGQLRSLSKDYLKACEQVSADAEAGSEMSIPTQSGMSANADNLNREKAFELMLVLAKFFHKTEPHSPIPYLLERAVKWGNLSLGQLMEELITDENARNQLFQLTGIQNTVDNTNN